MKLNQYIDLTLLKATATKEEIKTLCETAQKYHTFSVCVNPFYVKYAFSLLADTDVKVVTVIGFPLGANCADMKVQEAMHALQHGAAELDVVINQGAVKNQNYEYVMHEIQQIKQVAGSKVVKVIIETSELDQAEIVKLCQMLASIKIDFVKTSTGFSKAGAQVADVKIMADTLKNTSVKIKASGGIRTKEFAEALLQAGASRLGASSLALLS